MAINKKIIKIPDKIIISRSPQPCLLSFIFMSSRQVSILPLFLSLVRGLSHCPSQNPSCPIKAIGSSVEYLPWWLFLFTLLPLPFGLVYHSVSFAEAFYCPLLPFSIVTTFSGTMSESDSSAAFVRTHHCIGRYSLPQFFHCGTAQASRVCGI